MRTIVETTLFAKQADKLMGEDYLSELMDELARDPDAGGLIANTGGFRKIRGKRVGSGKRGGVRVFYYACKRILRPIYMVLCVKKSDDGPVSKDQCRVMRGLADEFETVNVVPMRKRSRQ